MKYEHKKEVTRWYKYGPGEEFETKSRAIQRLESDTRKKMTQFS